MKQNIVKVPKGGRATGDTYGEKGIEGGNDAMTPKPSSVPHPMETGMPATGKIRK